MSSQGAHQPPMPVPSTGAVCVKQEPQADSTAPRATPDLTVSSHGISGQSSAHTTDRSSPTPCPPGHHHDATSSCGPPGACGRERVETEAAQTRRGGGGQGEAASSPRHLKATELEDFEDDDDDDDDEAEEEEEEEQDEMTLLIFRSSAAAAAAQMATSVPPGLSDAVAGREDEQMGDGEQQEEGDEVAASAAATNGPPVPLWRMPFPPFPFRPPLDGRRGVVMGGMGVPPPTPDHENEAEGDGDEEHTPDGPDLAAAADGHLEDVCTSCERHYKSVRDKVKSSAFSRLNHHPHVTATFTPAPSPPPNTDEVTVTIGPFLAGDASDQSSHSHSDGYFVRGLATRPKGSKRWSFSKSLTYKVRSVLDHGVEKFRFTEEAGRRIIGRKIRHDDCEMLAATPPAPRPRHVPPSASGSAAEAAAMRDVTHHPPATDPSPTGEVAERRAGEPIEDWQAWWENAIDDLDDSSDEGGQGEGEGGDAAEEHAERTPQPGVQVKTERGPRDGGRTGRQQQQKQQHHDQAHTPEGTYLPAAPPPAAAAAAAAASSCHGPQRNSNPHYLGSFGGATALDKNTLNRGGRRGESPQAAAAAASSTGDGGREGGLLRALHRLPRKEKGGGDGEVGMDVDHKARKRGREPSSGSFGGELVDAKDALDVYAKQRLAELRRLNGYGRVGYGIYIVWHQFTWMVRVGSRSGRLAACDTISPSSRTQEAIDKALEEAVDTRNRLAETAGLPPIRSLHSRHCGGDEGEGDEQLPEGASEDEKGACALDKKTFNAYGKERQAALRRLNGVRGTHIMWHHNGWFIQIRLDNQQKSYRIGVRGRTRQAIDKALQEAVEKRNRLAKTVGLPPLRYPPGEGEEEEGNDGDEMDMAEHDDEEGEEGEHDQKARKRRKRKGGLLDGYAEDRMSELRHLNRHMSTYITWHPDGRWQVCVRHDGKSHYATVRPRARTREAIDEALDEAVDKRNKLLDTMGCPPIQPLPSRCRQRGGEGDGEGEDGEIEGSSVAPEEDQDDEQDSSFGGASVDKDALDRYARQRLADLRRLNVPEDINFRWHKFAWSIQFRHKGGRLWRTFPPLPFTQEAIDKALEEAVQARNQLASDLGRPPIRSLPSGHGQGVAEGSGEAHGDGEDEMEGSVGAPEVEEEEEQDETDEEYDRKPQKRARGRETPAGSSADLEKDALDRYAKQRLAELRRLNETDRINVSWYDFAWSIQLRQGSGRRRASHAINPRARTLQAIDKALEEAVDKRNRMAKTMGCPPIRSLPSGCPAGTGGVAEGSGEAGGQGDNDAEHGRLARVGDEEEEDDGHDHTGEQYDRKPQKRARGTEASAGSSAAAAAAAVDRDALDRYAKQRLAELRRLNESGRTQDRHTVGVALYATYWSGSSAAAAAAAAAAVDRDALDVYAKQRLAELRRLNVSERINVTWYDSTWVIRFRQGSGHRASHAINPQARTLEGIDKALEKAVETRNRLAKTIGSPPIQSLWSDHPAGAEEANEGEGDGHGDYEVVIEGSGGEPENGDGREKEEQEDDGDRDDAGLSSEKIQKAVEVRNKTLKDSPPLLLPQCLTASPTSPAAPPVAPPPPPPSAAAADASARHDTNEQQDQAAEMAEEGGPMMVGGERGNGDEPGGVLNGCDPSSPADQGVAAGDMQPRDMDMEV
ncbi:unnamed protein product [Vitrella brassicaformis CCMP3155]|uniref:Uncharacterized protein n=1 Tax=Vitrella brassicaformis (strain CCMP3155) TaxID=1169540 RepID=A0A0G4GFJ2_VITBC|nr:unnamed protein product [Vitrella brassicaformis CCMP3155]|eukprot:CEM28282.1 unnamed protein product [Vitrella brassicaformis CCMP3155]